MLVNVGIDSIDPSSCFAKLSVSDPKRIRGNDLQAFTYSKLRVHRPWAIA